MKDKLLEEIILDEIISTAKEIEKDDADLRKSVIISMVIGAKIAMDKLYEHKNYFPAKYYSTRIEQEYQRRIK